MDLLKGIHVTKNTITECTNVHLTPVTSQFAAACAFPGERDDRGEAHPSSAGKSHRDVLQDTITSILTPLTLLTTSLFWLLVKEWIGRSDVARRHARWIANRLIPLEFLCDALVPVGIVLADVDEGKRVPRRRQTQGTLPRQPVTSPHSSLRDIRRHEVTSLASGHRNWHGRLIWSLSRHGGRFRMTQE